MPELSDAQQMIAALSCDIELPDDWNDFFEKRGSIPTQWQDLRRFPRFHCRVSAAMVVRSSFPALERPSSAQRVLVKDISRSSIAFVHAEQLFPSEVVALTLFDGTERVVQVARCRRVKDRCFEIGARFVSTEE